MVETAAIPWIPITIAAVSVMIILIIATIFLCRRKRLRKKRECKTTTRKKDNKEDFTIKTHSDTQPADGVNNGQTNTNSLKPLSSPACPGVTVTLLNNSGLQDASEPLLLSVPGGIEDTPSYLASTYGPISVRDSQQSTLYAPSTVYHFDDLGSIEFADFNESDIFPHGGNYRNATRLYHAKSDKYIDPDVLALYSSDESIPSMLDEKYAISSNKTNGLAGSVPSGLHKSPTQNAGATVGISTSRSTASLSKMSAGAELSLPPNDGLESNQYWI